MKKYTALLTVVLSLFVATALQAASANMKFWSKLDDGTVAPAQDVHFTLMDLNSNTLAEENLVDPQGATYSVDLEPGVYFLSAEQPSTRYFGSMTLSMKAKAEEGETYAQDAEEPAEESADDDSEANDDDDDARYFLLSEDGLSEITWEELQELMAAPNAPEAIAADVAEPLYYYYYPTAGVAGAAAPVGAGVGGIGGGWGWLLGAGGLAGGIVAIATNDDNPVGPTVFMKNR